MISDQEYRQLQHFAERSELPGPAELAELVAILCRVALRFRHLDEALKREFVRHQP